MDQSLVVTIGKQYWFSVVSRGLKYFFKLTVKQSKTSECLPPAQRKGRVFALQGSTLAGGCQATIWDRKNADTHLTQHDSEKRFLVQITVGQNWYLTFSLKITIYSSTCCSSFKLLCLPCLYFTFRGRNILFCPPECVNEEEQRVSVCVHVCMYSLASPYV